MRNHVLRLWNHWTRYTCVNSLAAKGKPGINETNNTTERVIGWGIKERYRTVRGYKDQDSVLDVAHLTTWLQEGAEDREMEVPVFDLVEHRLDRLVIVRERLAHAGGQTRIAHELAQALACQAEMVGARVVADVSLFSGPGPFWQRGVRPLPNAH